MTQLTNTQGGFETAGPAPFNAEAFMAGLEGQLTEDRQRIVGELTRQPWFQATTPELQLELATLPQEGAANHDGFLADLAMRSSEIGGVRVESLADLPRGNFALIPKFNVRNIQSNLPYTYEYVSWRSGPLSGAKGVVFIRPEAGAEPTHFIVLAGEKFSTGRMQNDLVGGFMDLGVEGVQSVTDRLLVETRQELGIDDLSVDEVVDLGTIQVDAGMTNNGPQLFAAFISAAEAARIPSDPINPDVHELKAGAVIVPISQLAEIVRSNTDSFFSTAILKTLVSEQVNLPTREALHKALAVGAVALRGEVETTTELPEDQRLILRQQLQIADNRRRYQDAYIRVLHEIAAERGYEATELPESEAAALQAARRAALGV